MTSTAASAANGKTCPVIDFHVHVLEPSTYEKTINRNVLSGFGTRPMSPSTEGSERWGFWSRQTDPAAQIKDMDALGIDINVISVSGVAQSSWFAEPEDAAKLDRTANEGVARWVREFPTRFVGSFTLPMQNLDLALEELDYAVNTLKLKVANVSSNVGGVYLGDAKFRPFWEAVQALDVPVWIHPHGVQDMRLQKFALWNGVGQPYEETMVQCSIIYEGILESFPRLKIVMAHGGGYLPHYSGRLDRNFTMHPASAQNLKKLPSEYLKHFYFDTCVYEPSVLEDLVRHVGADRIVLGSDYPVGEKDPIGFIRACTNLSAAEVTMITSETPARILGLA